LDEARDTALFSVEARELLGDWPPLGYYISVGAWDRYEACTKLERPSGRF